ncbi:MAG TPA: hypothetical protein VNR65_06175 [Geobacterales bacterium]|nr:hypothetical protein [Geobacterales bacterium]
MVRLAGMRYGGRTVATALRMGRSGLSYRRHFTIRQPTLATQKAAGICALRLPGFEN